MPDKDGLNECGFLIGNVCKANHDYEFRITADFLRCLKIVGCQSWQEYLDYGTRRERFGNEAVDGKINDETYGRSTEDRKPRTATCEQDRKLSEMQELSKHQVAGDRDCGRNNGKETVPMRVLQANSDLDGITKDHRHYGNDIMRHTTCFVCGVNAVANHKGIWLCGEHLEKVKNGMSLKEQKDNEELK